MSRTLLYALVLAIALSGPASALSCLQTSLYDDYNIVDRSPDEYVVAVGSLSRTGPDVPSGDMSAGTDRNDPAGSDRFDPAGSGPGDPVGYSLPTRFVGNFLTVDGFTDRRDMTVRIDVSCIGPWCGAPPLADYALVFLRRNAPGAYGFSAGPCGGFFYTNPTEHQLLEVIGCYQDGGC